MQISASYPIPRNMLDTIEACTAGLGGVGIIGGAIGPGADLVVIAPAWAAMTVALAAQAGERMDEQTAEKLTIAVAMGVGGFAGGTKIAATVAGWLLAIPSAGLSLALAMGGNAALNAKFTHAYGASVARYFLQTNKIHDHEVLAKVLAALIATQFGIHRSHNLVTA